MTLPPVARKLLLAIHLTCSVGWIGGVCAYLALAVAASVASDPETIRAAWIALEVVGWYAIVPLAIGALCTGILVGLSTPWGLFRHYWVLVSLVGTTLLTAVLLLHMPDVSHQATVARNATPAALVDMGGDVLHALIGLLLLIGILVLNIFKPRGLTRHGWRRQQAQRRPPESGPLPTDSERRVRPSGGG